jgi:hypothetical protein
VLRLVTINSVEEKIMASANYKMELDEKVPMSNGLLWCCLLACVGSVIAAERY